jgi:hypothetical protein
VTRVTSVPEDPRDKVAGDAALAPPKLTAVAASVAVVAANASAVRVLSTITFSPFEPGFHRRPPAEADTIAAVPGRFGAFRGLIAAGAQRAEGESSSVRCTPR